MSNKNFHIKNGLSVGTGTEVITSAGAGTFPSATISGDLTVDTSTLKVDSSNNRVGIGDASPTTALHVATGTNSSGLIDVIRLENSGTSANDGPRIQLTAGDSTSGAGIGALGVSLNSAHLVFHSGGNNERMRLDNLGRLGINTDSPSMILNVHHSDQDGLRFNTTNTSETYIDFGDTDDNDVGRISYDHADNSMSFRTNATQFLKLSTQGTLNFTTPTTFSGQGDSLIGLHSNNYMYMYGGSAGLILHDNSAGSNRMLIRDSGSIELQTSGTERMKIASDGYMTLSRGGADYGLQIRSTSNRSGLVIDKPGTSTIMGSALVVAADERFKLGTASYYHVEMKQNGDTKINQNLLLTDSFGLRAYSGYFSAGTSTGTFIFNTYGSGVYEITAAFGHYGYIQNYGCFKKAICSNGQGYVSSNSIEVTDIATPVVTTNGGSWSFSGYNSSSVPSGSNTTGTVRVRKAAGTYGGGGYYFVEVRGNQSS